MNKEIQEKIEKHKLWLALQDGGEIADLRGADLSYAKLSGANLIFADLSEANLRGADLSEALLSGADLSLATLREADLSYAKLRGATLREADLSYANLREADLSYANLREADLSGADLREADLSEAKLPLVSIEPYLASKILDLVELQPKCLDMAKWHTCETTHCLAGWAVTLHSQGRLLESMLGTNAAGALIFNACCGEVPNFFLIEEKAIDWLRSKSNSKENEASTK